MEPAGREDMEEEEVEEEEEEDMVEAVMVVATPSALAPSAPWSSPLGQVEPTASMSRSVARCAPLSPPSNVSLCQSSSVQWSPDPSAPLSTNNSAPMCLSSNAPLSMSSSAPLCQARSAPPSPQLSAVEEDPVEAMEDHMVEAIVVEDPLEDHQVEAGLSTPSSNPQEVVEEAMDPPSGRDGLLIHLAQDLAMEEDVVEDQEEAMEAMVDLVEVIYA